MFFFFKQKTAYEMRISDWSSDVCSSDLSAIAAADGDFCAKEIVHLQQQVRSWTHLTPVQQRRLMAHLRLLIVTPVSVTSLKKKLEPLGLHARETLATFMVTVAQSDGVVLPAEEIGRAHVCTPVTNAHL